jgi:hypothetical protein
LIPLNKAYGQGGADLESVPGVQAAAHPEIEDANGV